MSIDRNREFAFVHSFRRRLFRRTLPATTICIPISHEALDKDTGTDIDLLIIQLCGDNDGKYN